MDASTNEEALLAKFQEQLAEAVARIDALTTELTAAGLNPNTVAAALSVRFEPEAVLTLIGASMQQHTARLRFIKEYGARLQ